MGFDQHAFVEAMGGAATAITQASAAGGQGRSSNLKRFIAHHPPTLVANHWFRQVERILKAMEITSDAMRIKLATFRLEGEPQVWWDWVRASRDPEMMIWGQFRELFMGKFSRNLLGMQKPRSSLS